MKIALIQQHASADKTENVARGLRAFEQAARPALYGAWLSVAAPERL